MGENASTSGPADAGRDLLLGLLALQNDFVSRDALVAAFAAWVADRTPPLGRLLPDAGALSPPRVRPLEALAAEHLDDHQGGVDQSLAALPPSSGCGRPWGSSAIATSRRRPGRRGPRLAGGDREGPRGEARPGPSRRPRRPQQPRRRLPGSRPRPRPRPTGDRRRTRRPWGPCWAWRPGPTASPWLPPWPRSGPTS